MNNGGEPLGFLGGSFDPVHIGHLRGAVAAREALHSLRSSLREVYMDECIPY